MRGHCPTAADFDTITRHTDMHTTDTTDTDPMLTDALESLTCADASTLTAVQRVQRAVVLALARHLLGDDPRAPEPGTPAAHALERLAWTLGAALEVGEHVTPADMDEGTGALRFDGGPVRGALTVETLLRLGEGWRFDDGHGYVVAVVGRAGDALGIVQPAPGYHEPSNRLFPAVPTDTVCASTADALAVQVRRWFDALDRLIARGVVERMDCGMYRCAPASISGHCDLLDEVDVRLERAGSRARLVDHGAVLDGLDVLHATERVVELGDADTGARFTLRPDDWEGHPWRIVAMNRAAFDALEAADALERATPFEVHSVTSTRGPVLRLGDAGTSTAPTVGPRS